MTVIRPNSISGVSSITAQGGEISYFKSDGTRGNQFTHNIHSTGVVTATSFVGSGTALTGIDAATLKFGSDTKAQAVSGGVNITGNLGVSGVLTYEDVTNVDSVGVITARSTIDAQGDVSIADKIIHTGDTNTALRFPAADTITAETNSSERLRITSGGLVGIGSVTPANQLDVQGGSHTKIHVGTTGTGHATGIQINHAKGNAALQQWQLQTDATSTANLIIRNATTGVTIQTFGTAGDITTPKHPIFATRIDYNNAYLNSGVKVAMKAAHIDTRSSFSDANDRYVAPAAGRYLFYFFSNIDYNGDGTIAVRFYKNGSEFTTTEGGHIYGYAQNAGWHLLSGQIITNMAVNDYMEVYRAANNMKVDGNNYGQFGGYMIG